MMLGIGPHGPTGPGARNGPHGAGEGGAGFPGTDPGLAASASFRDALGVLASVDGIGPITLERLLAAFGGPLEVLDVARRPGGADALRAATRGADERWPSMRISAADAICSAARSPEPILEDFLRAGVHVLLQEDASYPRRLREIALPPRLLFVRGRDGALDGQHAVAVVGTRRPTDEGRRTANRIGSALARAGAVVVSGLALGIDGAAHAAVVGEGGRTVAVIGGGHDRLFPQAHDRLGQAIVDGGGAVISEHAPGTQPSRGTFPRRNRVISGLVDAVVVVEAGIRSGALVTAAWALEQGRECFLVPGSIEATQSAGCLAWIRDYAGVARIVAGVPQLLEDLELDGLAAFPGAAEAAPVAPPGSALRPAVGQPARPSLDAVGFDVPDRERRLLVALDRGATTVDELAAATRQPVAAVLAGLTGLESRGLAEEAYGRYRIPSGATSRARRAMDPAA